MNTAELICERYGFDIDARPSFKINGSRWHELPTLLHSLDMKVGAEIGVEQGRYSKRLLEKNPGSKLYSIDAWQCYSGYREHVSQAKMDRFYMEAQERLHPYNSVIIKGFSVEVSEWFLEQDIQLDYVYIDGNHEFTQVTNDIAAWVRVVRPGGIIAGHDFKRSKGNYVCHVKDVIQAWTYSHGIRPWFIFTKDKAPSWMWVNG